MSKAGRPTKAPTKADRKKVTELLADKAPISDLAKLLGYSLPTFRKYFQEEIFSAKKSREATTPVRKVTDEQREKVKRYVGCKMPIRQVAYALGYETEPDFDTFKVDFQREIEIGGAVYRAKVLDQLDVQMRAGTVGATNKLEALTQVVEVGEGGPALGAGYVGKKAAAKADAEAVVTEGSKFAPRAAPRLATANGKPVDKRS
jgi:AraC-like DNA-binding protein